MPGVAVDRLKQLLAEVDRAADAASDLGASEMQIDKWAVLLHDTGQPDMVTAAGLRQILLWTAECHAEDCADAQCWLCEHLRNGLALTLAASRADLDAELERRLRYDAYDPARTTERARVVRRIDPNN
jgi:hypothetical protein